MESHSFSFVLFSTLRHKILTLDLRELKIHLQKTIGRQITKSSNLGPPHVLWQVSFGFWVTWSISSWQQIKRVFSFPSFNFWMINYSYKQKSYLQLWQNCFCQFITKQFRCLKSKQFSQFFLVRGNSERIDKI